MRRQKPLYRRQSVVPGFHHIVPAAAVNVDVNKSRRQYAVAKIHYAAILRDLAPRPRRHFHDELSSTSNSGCSIRCSGVNKVVAVIAIMDDYFVSEVFIL